MSSLKLHTYKNFIKSLLKTERRGRIQQLQNENKRKISIMTYERMQIIRKQQFIKDSNDEQKKLILQLNLLFLMTYKIVLWQRGSIFSMAWQLSFSIPFCKKTIIN